MFLNWLKAGVKRQKAQPRSRKAHRNRSLQLEMLEPRELLSCSGGRVENGALILEGCEAADAIRIYGNRAETIIETRSIRCPRGVPCVVPFVGYDVTTVIVFAKGGNDVITVDVNFNLPVVIHGGLGNDYIRGGAGDDQIFGEEGNDVVTTSRGHDAIQVGTGRNRIVFDPNASPDTVWIHLTGSFSGRGMVEGTPFAFGGTVTVDMTLDSSLSGQVSASGNGRGSGGGCSGFGVGYTTTGTITNGRLRATFSGGGSVTCPGETPDNFSFRGNVTGQVSLQTASLSASWVVSAGSTSIRGSWRGMIAISEISTSVL